MALPTALPSPRTPDPMLAPPLRWGVLGPGWIAERFVGSLRRSTRQPVVAVASRDLGRAQAFAARWGVDRTYGSYRALVEDPEVDVVYVATPTTPTGRARCWPSRPAATPWSRSRWPSTPPRSRSWPRPPGTTACS